MLEGEHDFVRRAAAAQKEALHRGAAGPQCGEYAFPRASAPFFACAHAAVALFVRNPEHREERHAIRTSGAPIHVLFVETREGLTVPRCRLTFGLGFVQVVYVGYRNWA